MTRRLLVVDDNPGYRLLVRLALAGTGWDVVGEAASLDAGCSLAIERAPDIVLLDLHLPGVEGRSGVAELQAAAPGSVLAGVSSLQALELPGAGGAVDMMVVPRGTSPAQLPALLDRLLDERSTVDVEATASMDLAPAPASARTARHFATEVLRGWGSEEDVVDTVLLLLSEVVSNVILHARTDLRICLVAHRDRVRVEVVDGAPGPIRRRVSGPEDQGGRGTELVEALAEAWGTDRLTTGKRVWFEVLWERDGDAPD